ncbi:ATP-dependent Clp protease ATP-binding subunit [Providencia stuartii]|uniref:ATP-dependent protease n=1 Tax=Providencia stuartii TaxID=588 RepID=A0A1S1HU43_PROST|nr:MULTISPECIES: AAA family ATPase [Providencia]ELR5300458.1 ATP-dependent Clp protease ATP-binding subunit [Providencia stuartii]MDW7588093.1 AAA family ATPase [Providencia sp. 2023EL-00965]OHT25864.1 ATP-dependent protease [Providencia stuartii]
MPFINDMLASNHPSQKNSDTQPSQHDLKGFRFTFDPDNVIQSIEKQIIGQDDVLKQLKDVLYCIKANIFDPERPLSTLLFLGPTGVGKTETVIALAKALNNGKNLSCRINMNTLSQDHYAASLSGAPPGYSGSKESYSLFDSDKIAGSYSTPSVVLFDEIEKASKEVIRTLLNILDTGELSLANGQKNINFRNAIIIMTSNLGSKDILNEKRTLFELFNSKSQQQKMLKQLEQRFEPEFINRIDRKISFKKIDSEQAIKIIDLELSKLNKRIARSFMTVVLDNAAKLKINSMCDRRYGVRDIKRVFKVHIEPLVANIILKGKHSEYIEFTVNDNQLTLKR